MIKRWLWLLLPLFLQAQTLEVGDRIAPLSLEDQYGRLHTLGKEQIWVVTWDKMTTRYANRYFETHRALLDQGRAAMIVDLSQTPSGILSLFVLPRMRSYGHPILLGYDADYNRHIPYREGEITLLYLEEGRITAIAYAGDEAALAELLD